MQLVSLTQESAELNSLPSETQHHLYRKRPPEGFTAFCSIALSLAVVVVQCSWFPLSVSERFSSALKSCLHRLVLVRSNAGYFINSQLN